MLRANRPGQFFALFSRQKRLCKRQSRIQYLRRGCVRNSRLFSRSRIPEQQRNAPRCGQRDQYIDDTAENGALPSEEPRHQVKAEDPDKTPVEPADDQQNECQFIYPHSFPTFQKYAEIPAAVIMHKSGRIIMSIYFFTTQFFYGKIFIYKFQHILRRAACLYTYAMIQGQTSSGWSTT